MRIKALNAIIAAAGAIVASTFFMGAAEPKPAVPPRQTVLQVDVSLPASANPLRDDDIAEAFAYRVLTSLHEQGLKGRIRYIDPDVRPDPNLPLLTIRLSEWRVDPIGNVDCSFTATIASPLGSKYLGSFTGTSMMAWFDRNWSSRTNAFETAAGLALNTLLKSIRESGVMPEPRPN